VDVPLLGATGNLKIYSNNYMYVMIFDLPMAFILLAITASMIGHGDTKSAMIINTGAVLLNLILDPVFIFSLNMDIKGAALATVLSKIPFVFIGFILLKRKKYLDLNFKNLFDSLLIKEFLRIAIPVFLGLIAETIGYMFLHSMTARYGSSPLAALGIVNIIIEFIRLPSRGISTVLATIAGQNLGAKNFERVSKSFKVSIGMTFIIMFFLGGLMILFSRYILEFFIIDNVKAVEEGIMYLNLQGITIVFLGMNACLMKFFEGVGRSEFSMSMNIVRLWFVRIPMIWICSYFGIFGVNSVWYAMVLGNMVAWIIGVVGCFKIRNFK
jgi:putative MATE family efflux protein